MIDNLQLFLKNSVYVRVFIVIISDTSCIIVFSIKMETIKIGRRNDKINFFTSHIFTELCRIDLRV